jgi:hypothetical protein
MLAEVETAVFLFCVKHTLLRALRMVVMVVTAAMSTFKRRMAKPRCTSWHGSDSFEPVVANMDREAQRVEHEERILL